MLFCDRFQTSLNIKVFDKKVPNESILQFQIIVPPLLINFGPFFIWTPSRPSPLPFLINFQDLFCRFLRDCLNKQFYLRNCKMKDAHERWLVRCSPCTPGFSQSNALKQWSRVATFDREQFSGPRQAISTSLFIDIYLICGTLLLLRLPFLFGTALQSRVKLP